MDIEFHDYRIMFHIQMFIHMQPIKRTVSFICTLVKFTSSLTLLIYAGITPCSHQDEQFTYF